MRQSIILISFIIFLASCDKTTQIEPGSEVISLLPYPKEISPSTNMVSLSNNSKMYSPNEIIQPLLQLFQSELKMLTGFTIESSNIKNHVADVFLGTDKIVC